MQARQREALSYTDGPLQLRIVASFQLYDDVKAMCIQYAPWVMMGLHLDKPIVWGCFVCLFGWLF